MPGRTDDPYIDPHDDDVADYGPHRPVYPPEPEPEPAPDHDRSTPLKFPTPEQEPNWA